MLAQVLAHHAADVLRVCDHAIQRAILSEPFHSSLRPDFIHARHAIHGVAHQRQIIDDALRRHAEFCQHARFIECLVAHGVDQRDMMIDQLRQVFIAGRDDAVNGSSRGRMRQRADHIVGFNTVYHHQRPARRTDAFMQQRNLRGEIFGHGGPVRFVFGIPVFAEGFSLGVEHHGAVICLIVGFQHAQHREHTADGASGFIRGIA